MLKLKKYNIILFTLIIIFLFVGNSQAKHLHHEKWYQDIWCGEHNGQTEVLFEDKTRCDCVTKLNAIEFDFGSKWAEAIGQALHYSIKTNKRGGVVLILESEEDYKYWIRINNIIDYFDLPIDLWKMEP